MPAPDPKALLLMAIEVRVVACKHTREMQPAAAVSTDRLAHATALPAHQVVKLAGKRAVLVAGWSELGGLVGDGPDQVALPEQLLVLPEAPHDWLLPRCGPAR